MMNILLWVSLLSIVYTWFGYPLILWMICELRGKENLYSGSIFPRVTIILPVFNEQARIEKRIENILSLSYPKDKLEILVGSDGSTDQTDNVVSKYNNILSIFRYTRVGKSRVQNNLIKHASGDIIIFTDAGTLFEPDFIFSLVQPFADEDVGCVVGNLNWLNSSASSVAQSGGIYWRYEKFLWKLESRLGLLAWGSGTCLGIRKSLFREIPSHLGEDSYIPLDIVEQGKKVLFQPDAKAYDSWAEDFFEEYNSRVRMTLRSFSATINKSKLISFYFNPRISWSIWSHKLLRWFTPYFAIITFISSLYLVNGSYVARTIFFSQLAIYIIGIFGLVIAAKGRKIPIIFHLGNFLLVLVGFAVGVFQAIMGQRIFTYRAAKPNLIK